MRIAFLTPEYPSELVDRGGIGTYVHRTAQLLREFDHEPEVFVGTEENSGTIYYQGICVHRINWNKKYGLIHRVHKASLRFVRSYTWETALPWMLQARALSIALERRHAVAPFQLVQSSDYMAPGLFIRRRPDRVHVVRCSSASDLYSDYDKAIGYWVDLRGVFERLSMRRANAAYAPSRYLADHYRRKYDIPVRVVRPSKYLATKPMADSSISLPGRFLIHFGQLMERKGTALLAQALPIAWKAVPNLTMVWSGPCWQPEKMAAWRAIWGERSAQIHVTGPLQRANLYGLLQRADAAVLPSQVDNLPNTVIESLMFGVPVIGTRGASIDELVEEGRTGHLVALGDVAGLAEALVKVWLGNTPVRKGFVWSSEITREMEPERAVANLIALADTTH